MNHVSGQRCPVNHFTGVDICIAFYVKKAKKKKKNAFWTVWDFDCINSSGN